MGQYHSDSKTHFDMRKVVAVLSYFTPLGWLVALVLHGNSKSFYTSFHLRQSLGLILTMALLSFIPLIGWLLTIGVAFAWFVAVYDAFCGNTKEVPLLGRYFQVHLDFIN